MKLFEIKNVDSIIIEETENQYAEKVVVDAISFVAEKNIFIREWLSCRSAQSENMGICRCENHDTWKEEEISFQELAEVI